MEISCSDGAGHFAIRNFHPGKWIGYRADFSRGWIKISRGKRGTLAFDEAIGHA